MSKFKAEISFIACVNYVWFTTDIYSRSLYGSWIVCGTALP